MKECITCGNTKETDNFHKNKKSVDGFVSQCKKCKREYDKKYHYSNIDKRSIQKKKWYEENKEHKKRYLNLQIPYNSKSKYRKEIELYEEIKEPSNGNLMCKCAYCGEWFEPTYEQIRNRISAINGIYTDRNTENRLYCSQSCKYSCPIFNQTLYQKDHKPATSREVQPELRQMVFERDNYTCQKCNTHRDNLEVGIHCHHKEGILWEPLQSADMDMCITYCEDCHKEVHGIDGCGYYEMKCA